MENAFIIVREQLNETGNVFVNSEIGSCESVDEQAILKDSSGAFTYEL